MKWFHAKLAKAQRLFIPSFLFCSSLALLPCLKYLILKHKDSQFIDNSEYPIFNQFYIKIHQ